MRRELFRRYLELYRQPKVAWMVARVPTLAIWDDHDICDGWGSLPPERMDSPFGRAVFAVARELYLLFQQGAVAPDYPPAFGDRSGTSLGRSEERRVGQGGVSKCRCRWSTYD